MKFTRTLLLALGLALVSPLPSIAQAANEDDTDELVMTSEGFLGYHPDLRYRLLGLGEYRDGNYEQAMVHFRRAARFASSSPSQVNWGMGPDYAVRRPTAEVGNAAPCARSRGRS